MWLHEKLAAVDVVVSRMLMCYFLIYSIFAVVGLNVCVRDTVEVVVCVERRNKAKKRSEKTKAYVEQN